MAFANVALILSHHKQRDGIKSTTGTDRNRTRPRHPPQPSLWQRSSGQRKVCPNLSFLTKGKREKEQQQWLGGDLPKTGSPVHLAPRQQPFQPLLHSIKCSEWVASAADNKGPVLRKLLSQETTPTSGEGAAHNHGGPTRPLQLP